MKQLSITACFRDVRTVLFRTIILYNSNQIQLTEQLYTKNGKLAGDLSPYWNDLLDRMALK